MKGDILTADQWLIKCKQNLIYFKNIVILFPQEIFDNNVKFTAVGHGKACSADQVACFIQTQLQCHSKCNRCGFAWLVIRIVFDL